MRINNNMMAMNTHRQLGLANAGGAKSMEKLSSGMRINRAGDDAAGLAISEKMRGQIRGLNQASSNAQDGISLIQTAEGALNETHAILQRMRELAVQSSTDTNTNDDRKEIQKEVDQLSAEITRIAETTQFNTMELLDGKFADKKFHIGSNKGQNTTIDISDMKSKALGVEGAATGIVEKDIESAAALATVAASAITSAKVGDKFSVEKLSKETTVNVKDAAAPADDVKVNYVLRDKDQNIVGVSEDGKMFNLVDATKTLTDKLSDVKFGTTVEMKIGADANFTAVTSGTIEITANTDGTDMKIKADNTLVSDVGDLAAGKYTVSKKVPGHKFALVDANGKTVADGGADGKGKWTDMAGNELFDFDISAMTEITVGGGGGIDVSSQASADAAIETINSAITNVSGERSKLGAMQNRLEHTIKNLDNTSENLQAAEARIRDVDMAKEMMEQTRQNILAQASTAMLAQANQAPQAVLQLLR